MEDNIVLIAVGIIIVILGIINIRGNISTLHWYHRKRVAESDIPAFGKVVGTGTVIIGASMFLSGIISIFAKSAFIYLIAVAGLVAGIPIMLYGMIKYNKGIF